MFKQLNNRESPTRHDTLRVLSQLRLASSLTLDVPLFRRHPCPACCFSCAWSLWLQISDLPLMTRVQGPGSKPTKKRPSKKSCESKARTAYALRKSAYDPRTPHVRLRMPCIRCCNMDCWSTYKKGEPQKKGLSETSLLPSLWVDRVRSFRRRFCDRVPGRVVSRLAPDRRQARWWPKALSILGLRSLKRHPSGTNLHCDKRHTVVTRPTTTGAEDMAISLNPTGQGRHQKSRWSRPGSCRTRTVPVIPPGELP